MTIDTRMSLMPSEEILEKTHRLGHLPEGAQWTMLFIKDASSPAKIAGSPTLDLSDETYGRARWTYDDPYFITPGCVYGAPKWKTELYKRMVEGEETLCLTPEREPDRDVCILEPVVKGEKMRLEVPIGPGVLLGLLGPDGKPEGAPLKLPEDIYNIFKTFGPLLLDIEQLKKGLPTTQFTGRKKSDSDWVSQKAKELSERTASLRSVSTALTNRRPRRPLRYTFSGNLPDGTPLKGWTAEMLMTRMTTYVFMPFLTSIKYKKDKGCFAVMRLAIPAFSEEQARIILEKRIYEWSRMMYHGKPMYTKAALLEMKCREEWADFIGDEIGSTVLFVPDFSKIQVLETHPTRLTDFFVVTDNVFNAVSFNLMEDVAKGAQEVPMASGWWTSDDLGFAFANIFAPELGFSSDIQYPTNLIFSAPYIIRKATP